MYAFKTTGKYNMAEAKIPRTNMKEFCKKRMEPVK